MKTQNAILKTMFLFGLSSLFTLKASAQETKTIEKRVMRVKMVQEKNGVKTEIDTTVENNGNFDAESFLKSKGIEIPLDKETDENGKRTIHAKTYSFTDTLKHSDLSTDGGKKIICIKRDTTFNIDINETSTLEDANVEKFIQDIISDTAISKYFGKEKSGKIIITNDVENIKHLPTKNSKQVVIIKKTIVTKSSTGKKDKSRKNMTSETTVFPNPNHGAFKVSFENAQKSNVTITIADKNAVVVYEEKLNDFKGKYEKEIDLSAQPKGTYYLNIKQGKQETNSKIVIE